MSAELYDHDELIISGVIIEGNIENMQDSVICGLENTVTDVVHGQIYYRCICKMPTDLQEWTFAHSHVPIIICALYSAVVPQGKTVPVASCF